MKYEEMLDRAFKLMPEINTKGERFEVPKAHGRIQGNTTIITNFQQMVQLFRRDSEHFLKFLQKELATPAQIDGPRLVLKRKLSPALINAKIKKYADEFVLCYTCKKPDTQIIEENGVNVLKCAACGAKHKIKSVF
ncbi:translation initiation factor IF-2 subunit beta [Candidatus Woesearchaeota archaeon]|nr:MAG: translation initiation factor IF-2 subunit beta [Candidatus Woesearchaeota archaeon]